MQVERNYDFRKRLLKVHHENINDYIETPYENELLITEQFKIIISKNSGRVIKNAARDLCNYLLISLGIGISVVYRNEFNLKAENSIFICTKDEIRYTIKDGKGSYMVSVNNNVILCGYDERGAAQAVYYIEDLMSLRKAPYLNKETIFKKPLFSPRMTHSGYGLDNYPNEHLSAIAHSGMDSIIVFVRSHDESAIGYMDLNEIIYRAEGYGLDVYAYSYIKSLYHPEDERAYSYYNDCYGKLFNKCPKLKGIILVGESIGFRSKDSHTNGLLCGEKNLFHGDKPSPSSYPCYDYADLLELLKKVIRKENADADIVLWTYNFNGAPCEERISLINNLPSDISLLSTFEKPQMIKYGNSIIPCTDYTLVFEGPGENFLSEAKAASERGIRLYTMSNTGGLTWDLGTVPYLPCPMQWKKRYDKLKECREKYGLSGLMESHHYGFYPSFVSELSKWEFYSNSPNYLDIMKKIAMRDFGKGNEDIVIAAWKKLSQAICCCPPSVEDQYGPLRIGPAYPLSLNIHHDIKSVPYAMFGGEKICRTMYSCYDSDCIRYKGRTLFPIRIKEDIRLLKKAIILTDDAGSMLENIAKSEEAFYIVNLVKYMANCFRTVINVKEWYILKLKLLSCGEAKKVKEIAVKMHKIADKEIENAKNTLKFVDFDSRLGYEPSMEYIGDREHIEIKIKQMEILIKTELLDYEMCSDLN